MKEIKPKLETEGFKVDEFDFVGSPKPLPKNIGNQQSSPKSLDTTTTIDKEQTVFTNLAPEDKEWTAHVNLLNKWTPQESVLRHIIQYARSGKHYPTDMHVDLILQWHQDKARSYVLEVIGEDVKLPESLINYDDDATKNYFQNKLRAEQRAKLDQTLKAIGGQDNE